MSRALAGVSADPPNEDGFHAPSCNLVVACAPGAPVQPGDPVFDVGYQPLPGVTPSAIAVSLTAVPAPSPAGRLAVRRRGRAAA